MPISSAQKFAKMAADISNAHMAAQVAGTIHKPLYDPAYEVEMETPVDPSEILSGEEEEDITVDEGDGITCTMRKLLGVYPLINMEQPKIYESSTSGLCKLHDEEVYVGVEIEMEEPQSLVGKSKTNYSIGASLDDVESILGMLDPTTDKKLAMKLAVFHSLWKTDVDHSLRGDSSKEYIFGKPYKGRAVQLSLKSLEDVFKELPGTPLLSARCSAHVHFNVLDLTVQQYFMQLLFFLLYEPVLYKFCGPRRVDNIYCVPVFMSEQTSGYLGKAFYALKHGGTSMPSVSKTLSYLTNQWPKYSGINIGSNKKCKGTIEYRQLPTTVDAERLTTWINLLARTRTAALLAVKNGASYEDVVNTAMDDPEKMAMQVFGEDFPALMKHSEMRDLWEGARHTTRVISSMQSTIS